MYTFFGIDRNATDKQLKKVYRKLVMKFHPDRYRGNNEQHRKLMWEKLEKFKTIIDDQQCRDEYDSGKPIEEILQDRRVRIQDERSTYGLKFYVGLSNAVSAFPQVVYNYSINGLYYYLTRGSKYIMHYKKIFDLTVLLRCENSSQKADQLRGEKFNAMLDLQKKLFNNKLSSNERAELREKLKKQKEKYQDIQDESEYEAETSQYFFQKFLRKLA